MADHADDDRDIFIYRGGRAPQHVTHVRIDKSVDEIEKNAFKDCEHLVKVDTHDGLRKVGSMVFWGCRSLRRINLKSVVEIDEYAFCRCENLESVEFGGNLERIGNDAFMGCSLTHLKLPSIITIGISAFWDCTRLIDIELSERLETIEAGAFGRCERLQRIAIPLKRGLIVYDSVYHDYTQFDYCEQLATVDLIGGVYKTVASLHMKSWRTEMTAEINRINQVLSNTPSDEKTNVIRQWMDSVMDKMDHYKAEHYRYIKEGITLLELALWKAKLLGEKEEYAAEGEPKKAKVDTESARKERRITCGADMVIKNVLPFLQLE
eukprot:scaffold29433_cov223-Skeletonema_menzelii.AAC.2